MPLPQVFTPIESGVGGIIIGTACALALLVNGRIAGCSGVVGPMMRNMLLGGPIRFQALFVSGMMCGGLANLMFNRDFAFPQILELNEGSPLGSLFVYAIGGALVGVGTRAGTGCTSGHGLCGLARISPRSLVAICLLMGTGFLTVFLKERAMSTPIDFAVVGFQWPATNFTLFASIITLVLALLTGLIRVHQDIHTPLVAGFLFGLGLGCAGMTSQAKVIGFLNLTTGAWDPSLAFVMGGGFCMTFPAYAVARREGARPQLPETDWEKPGPGGPGPLTVAWNKPDMKMSFGMIAFGVGWGITGICPGPALATLIPSVVIGSYHAGILLLSFPVFTLVFCSSWLITDRLQASETQKMKSSLLSDAKSDNPASPLMSSS